MTDHFIAPSFGRRYAQETGRSYSERPLGEDALGRFLEAQEFPAKSTPGLRAIDHLH
jgi:hypothetical protein